jgi:phosphoenolpyruvate phosphomutase/phosphonopyruvate hydrolase
MVMYGNHAIRAAVAGMQAVFARIRADGGIREADQSLVSVDEIFRLQDMDRIRAHEQQFLR